MVLRNFFKENKTFLVLLFIVVAIRLVNINMPILEGTATRQVQTAMIARNLYTNGFNLFYPQVDFLGPGSGYLVLEFPLLNLIAAVFYVLCGGVHEWIGRLISISFFAGSVIFLFNLIRRLFEERTALITIVIYSISPLGLIYSRAFMPDFEMIFFFIGSLYFMYLWSVGDKDRFFWFSAIFAMMAMLSKIQAFCICIPLLAIIWQRQHLSFLFKARSWAYFLIVSIPVLLWYMHAKNVHQVYSQSEAYAFQITNWFRFSLFISPKFYIEVFEHGWMQMLTPVGFTLFLFGLFLKTDSQHGKILRAWLCGTVVYMVVFITHMRDPYYNLLFLPITSIFAARAVVWIWQHASEEMIFLHSRFARIVGIVLLFILIGRYAAYAYTVPRGYRHIPMLAKTIEQMTDKNDLLITSLPDGHATHYYSKRKGWCFGLPGNDPEKTKEAIDRVEELQKKGAKYFVSVCENFLEQSAEFQHYLRRRYVVVKEEPGLYSIFLLKL
jgi:4-amino-4-deoxy-L-arabinose transferase-like glycosyltransferase